MPWADSVVQALARVTMSESRLCASAEIDGWRRGRFGATGKVGNVRVQAVLN